MTSDLFSIFPSNITLQGLSHLDDVRGGDEDHVHAAPVAAPGLQLGPLVQGEPRVRVAGAREVHPDDRVIPVDWEEELLDVSINIINLLFGFPLFKYGAAWTEDWFLMMRMKEMTRIRKVRRAERILVYPADWDHPSIYIGNREKRDLRVVGNCLNEFE